MEGNVGIGTIGTSYDAQFYKCECDVLQFNLFQKSSLKEVYRNMRS